MPPSCNSPKATDYEKLLLRPVNNPKKGDLPESFPTSSGLATHFGERGKTRVSEKGQNICHPEKIAISV